MNAQFQSRLLDLAQNMVAAQPTGAIELLSTVQDLYQDLTREADTWLVEGATADQVANGVRYAQAAIELGPALLALNTAVQYSDNLPSEDLSRSITAIQQRIAHSRVLCTLKPLAQISHTEEATPAPAPASASDATPAREPTENPGSAPSADPMNLAVLRNIATYHRAHERHYTVYFTQAAVDLYNEANKLKVVAEVWLDERQAEASSTIDYTMPAYRPAGCVDLNPLSAIPAIGILFMEGENEPAEIRVMKSKLQGLAMAWEKTGAWLAERMEEAWKREQALFTPGLIRLAQPRLNTIATNWRGAREMALAGKVVMLAITALQAMDLSPAAIRRDKRAAGKRLLDAAWMISMAAQTDARSGAELADNDRNWTAYLEGLKSLPNGAPR